MLCRQVRADDPADLGMSHDLTGPRWLLHSLPPTRALAGRLEIHHTPKHGSWPNIAEIELSALTRQCLDRRIDDLAVLDRELTARQNLTNAGQRHVNRHVTTSDARTRLRHLSPTCETQRPTRGPGG